MNTPVRLLASAAVLVVVFAIALIGGRTLLPAGLAQAWQGRTGNTPSTGTADHSEGTPRPVTIRRAARTARSRPGLTPHRTRSVDCRSLRTATSWRRCRRRGGSARTAR